MKSDPFSDARKDVAVTEGEERNPPVPLHLQ